MGTGGKINCDGDHRRIGIVLGKSAKGCTGLRPAFLLLLESLCWNRKNQSSMFDSF